MLIRYTVRQLDRGEGLVRSIGLSNFSAAKMADVLSYASVRPSVCQAVTYL